MYKDANRRLANVRTRVETGFDYVRTGLNIQTPFGKKILKELKPFFPGEEEALREELANVEVLIRLVENKPKSVAGLQETFMCMKDITHTVERSKNNVLSVVELFEIKSLLLNLREIRRITLGSKIELPEEFIPLDMDELLNVLDPRRDRINTFYIYDDFSEELASLRKKKKDLEKKMRLIMKKRKTQIFEEFGISLTPKFDVVVSKSDEQLGIIKSIEDLEPVNEDYMSVTFELVKNKECHAIDGEIESLNTEIEAVELSIQKELSEEVDKCASMLLTSVFRTGRLDFVLAKAIYAINHSCVKPEISDEHIINILNGRQLQVEDVLKSKGKEYCPISISLCDGVTCITGANMGGKTISLKLAGLVPLMTQYGFYVPCEAAEVGLSNFIQILIGDSQSVERGLSSFGSEMEELKEILDNAKDRSLLLIDEIASGTNPVEGLALTKSLTSYLKERPYISLITTHFESVAEDKAVVNMQVMGLSKVDFSKLDSELRYANRKERINIIGKYMDYRLVRVDDKGKIPKDALNIAKMLGINKEIIDSAKNILSKEITG